MTLVGELMDNNARVAKERGELLRRVSLLEDELRASQSVSQKQSYELCEALEGVISIVDDYLPNTTAPRLRRAIALLKSHGFALDSDVVALSMVKELEKERDDLLEALADLRDRNLLRCILGVGFAVCGDCARCRARALLGKETP